MSIPRENVFALVIGLMDGILTALTLAAGKIVETGSPLSIDLAFRISVGAAASGVCVFFVAEYARQRGDMVHAEKHLNLSSHGKLAVSRLGGMAIRQAGIGAAISCTCSFFGALLPLLPAAIVPNKPWLALVAALVALAFLGVCLGRVNYGSPVAWALALVLIGVSLAVIGIELHIV
jgi:predicted membrane protein (TIGR00267 family)